MSRYKVYLCDLIVVLLFSLVIVSLAEEKSGAADDGERGNCSCGAFPTKTPEADTAPILSRLPGLEVKCDAEGETTCKSLCNALAIATKAKGPEILCTKLDNATELKLSAFSKICDKPWVYADMTADEPLCCESGKPVVCESVAQANVTKVKQYYYVL